VIVDGTLLRIDRVGMSSGRDRPFYSGKHKCHGVNVQVIADPAGRLIWASPALPGARHDMGAAREHGILDALREAGIRVIADSGYRGSGFEVPQRRRRRDPARPARQRLSHNQRAVNTAHARVRGPGERSGRTSERPAQDLEDPPQNPLLPAPDHRPRQSRPGPHPRRLNTKWKGLTQLPHGFCRLLLWSTAPSGHAGPAFGYLEACG